MRSVYLYTQNAYPTLVMSSSNHEQNPPPLKLRGTDASNPFSWHTLILAILVLFVACMAFLFIRDVFFMRQHGALTPQHRPKDILSLIGPRRSIHFTTATTSVDTIQDWMTFGYLNQTFHLPISYLQTKLSIIDTRYPNMSIRQYAKDIQQTSTSTLETVKNAVRGEQASSTHL